MLHMVVQTHTAESCPYRSEENLKAMGEAFNRARSLEKEQGAQMLGGWASSASHTTFTLVEAPSAHVVSTLMEASGLTARGTATIYAVTEMAAAMAALGM
jgi:hypothetical protein